MRGLFGYCKVRQCVVHSSSSCSQTGLSHMKVGEAMPSSGRQQHRPRMARRSRSAIAIRPVVAAHVIERTVIKQPVAIGWTNPMEALPIAACPALRYACVIRAGRNLAKGAHGLSSDYRAPDQLVTDVIAQLVGPQDQQPEAVRAL